MSSIIPIITPPPPPFPSSYSRAALPQLERLTPYNHTLLQTHTIVTKIDRKLSRPTEMEENYGSI